MTTGQVKSNKIDKVKNKKIKDDNTEVQMIRKEDVTDYTTIREGHIKSRVSSVKRGVYKLT